MPSLSVALAYGASIFCEGPLLHAIQTMHIFTDSKTFVDMPCKLDPEIVLNKFLSLSPIERIQPDKLQSFIDEYFDPAGSDLVSVKPADFHDEPPFLLNIEDAEIRDWAADLNNLWLSLSRNVTSDVAINPQRHSLLPRKHTMIIPGGRFRESYYWDSFWIVRGLLVCGMSSTALGVVQILLEDVAAFTHVPNGGRIYYTERSQPPMLSEMVLEILSSASFSADQLVFLADATRLMEKEYKFWMTERFVVIKGHTLNRYWSDSTRAHPRPESYNEDIFTAENVTSIYAEITATAESGWDFSSRWWTLSSNISTDNPLRNTNIRMTVPVDLNVILYRYEINLAYFFQLLNSDSTSQQYLNNASRRAQAINELMWDSENHFWRDLVLGDGPPPESNNFDNFELSQHVSVACFVPIWGGTAFHNEHVLDAFIKSNLIGAGGVLTTLIESDQQWDKPNSWPPLQWFIVEGLRDMNTPESIELSDTLALSWLDGAYKAWVDTGFMLEKYDGEVLGGIGEGGEYVPQVGFGWTNGVALDWIKRYYSNTAGES